jgi:hypothetical protein
MTTDNTKTAVDPFSYGPRQPSEGRGRPQPTQSKESIEARAVLTDNLLLKIAPEIAAHLAHPEFCVFASRDRAGAVDWLKGAQA